MAITTMAMWREGEDLTHHQQQSFDNVIAALAAGGFTVAVADVYQGSRIQGAFSHTPVDFQGLADVEEFAGQAIRAGVRFWPMVNPFGVDPEGEARLHAEAARRVSERVGEPVPLVVDYEYRYDGFFGVEFGTGKNLFPPEQGLPRTQTYFAHLRHELGALPVFVCPDPRQVGRDYPLSAFPPDAVLLLQTYHLDFRESWQVTFAKYLPPRTGLGEAAMHVARTEAAAAGYGGRTAVPMVTGNDRTVALREQLAWIDGRFGQACVWGFGDLVASAHPGAPDDFTVFKAVAGGFALPT